VTISYPLSFPETVAPNSFVLTPRNIIGVNRSPFTAAQQVYDNGGAYWELSASLPPMERETADAYIAFFTALKGTFGTFTIKIPQAGSSKGAATGTPLVNGAAQTGAVLNTDGWTSGVTGILKAGDYIQLGSAATTRLYKNLEDANSDGSGQAALSLWPALRSAPSDNQAITVSNCKGLFRLNGDVEVSLDINGHYTMQFSAYEAL